MTIEAIEKVLLKGNNGKYSHLIIYCDHWDYTDSYKYVKYGEDITKIIDQIKSSGSPGMFSIEEIYNYNLDLKKQIDEVRAYHIEPLQKKENNNINEIYISEKLKEAIEYATKMHEGQTRKDGTPYINHPLRVVEKVLYYKKSKNLETLLISACLHDTIEDTEATYYDINEKFGAQVASIVLELTTDKDMKNEIGKKCYLQIKMKNMSSWALVIKLCDRLDNVSDLINCNDSKFINKYIDETIGILKYLLENRKLSNTHISIIESIIILLFQLGKYDKHIVNEILEISEMCLNQKNKTVIEEISRGNIYKKTNNI